MTNSLKSRLPFSSFIIIVILSPSFVTPGSYGSIGQDRGKEKVTPLIKELPPSQKRYALIIGVSKYRDKRIPSLMASTNDADTLAEALVKYAGFPRDQVIVLATNKTEEFQPEGNIILEYVSTLTRLAGKDGLFLMAYSGHGYEMDGQSFLLGSDARLIQDLKVLKKTCVAWSEITEIIDDASVGQIIVLLDACRSDPRSAKGTDQPNQMTQIYQRGLHLGKEQDTKRAFVKILATQKGEQAYEDTAQNLGFFMFAIVEAIKGEAANQSGVITLTSLWRYVDAKVQAHARLRGRSQRPVIEIQSYDEEQLVIAELAHDAVNKRKENVLPIPAENPVLAELSEWIRVRKSSTREEYERFCAKFPSGNFCEDARNRITEIDERERTKPSVVGPPLTSPKIDKGEPNEAAPATKPITEDLAYAHKGDQLVANRRFEEAEAAYREAIQKNPNKAVYYGKLGIALYQQRKYKEAEAEYKKATKLDPHSADLFFNLGLALYQRQKYADAETEFRRALKINPNEAAFHSNLGTTLAIRGKLLEAEVEFREAIKFSPTDASHHHGLGNVLVRQTRYSQAEAAYKTAIQLDPSNSTYTQSLQNLKKHVRH